MASEKRFKHLYYSSRRNGTATAEYNGGKTAALSIIIYEEQNKTMRTNRQACRHGLDDEKGISYEIFEKKKETLFRILEINGL